MYNSMFVNVCAKLGKVFANSYNNSIFSRIFEAADKFLISAVSNSRIINGFVGCGKSFVQGSLVYKASKKIWALLDNLRLNTYKWFAESNIINLFRGLISYAEKRPLRMVGIFGIAMMVSNITFSIFENTSSIKSIVAKLIVLILFIVISRMKLNLKSVISDSFFFRMAKWFLSYEK